MSSKPGAPKAPQIVTFYSYKGGTGRSMALANVAFILAGNGYRVLAIDWDLEAPGLHRYFHPFLVDKELNTSQGVIDFVMAYATKAASTPDPPEDWYVPYCNILRYTLSLDFAHPGWGVIDFVPAGRQGPDYAAKVNSFNWQHFYEELDGGMFLEFSKTSMIGYDFVLIDSRTGVSDTSGICTVQMPEKLVVCFTPNSQSIAGAAAVAESAYHQRIKPDGTPGLSILPVLTRVERGEQERIQTAKDLARLRFDSLIENLTAEARDLYWSRISVPHEPYYSFEEILAVFAEKPEASSSMFAVMKLLGEYVAGKELKFPEIEPAVREHVLETFTRRMKRKIIRSLSIQGGAVTDIGLSADGTRAASAQAQGSVAIWDLEPGRVRHSIQVQRTRKIGIAISANGREVAVGTRGATMWDAETGAQLSEFGGPEDIVAIRLTRDGTRALCCSTDRSVKLWDIARNECLLTLFGHKDWVRSLALSENGQRAISGGDDKTLIVWNLQTGQALRKLHTHREGVRSVDMSSDGLLAVSGSDDGTVIVWDLEKGEPRHIWALHGCPVTAVNLNRDGKLAISGGQDGRIFFWNAESGEPLRLLEGHLGAVTALALSSGGRRAVSGGADGNVILWDPEAGERVESTPKPVVPEPQPSVRPLPQPEPKGNRPWLEPSLVAPQAADVRTIIERYLYFASLARSDRDELSGKFHADLLSEVRSQTGADVAAYLDATDPSIGEEWPSPVREALEASRVLLAFYSPNYFHNERCGREFGAFSHDASRRILPVIWIPSKIPPPGNEIQYRHDQMPEIYSIEGLRYMMRLRKHREAYFLVVSSLAEFLGHLIQTRPPVLAPLPPLDQLSSAFLTGTELRTTADLGFAFLVPSRSEYLPPDADRTGYGTNARDWTPFSRGTPIGQLAAQAAIELGLTYEEIPINADFPEAVRLRLAARAPIVVFVDPNTLRIDRFKPLLQVLISNPADNVFPITTRLDSALMSFPNLGAYIAADEKGIVSAISRAVTKFRLSIISRSGTDQGADLDPLLNLHGGSN